MRASSRRRDEDGAVAFMTVILSVVLFGAAAIAIDISMLAMERQKLHDAVDAAAHAGAYTMPGDGATAMKAARDMALANDPDLTYDFTEQNPQIRLWCLVASTGAGTSVRTDQIPSTCNPGPAPYTTSRYPDLRCNTKICKIPCAPSLTTICNTVEVVAEKDVDFGFANIFGRSEGSTGSVASAACKGSCGQEAPNPLDVVFMADRTVSMSDTNRNTMMDAIKSTLLTMDPTMHYVALGTISKSVSTGACPTAPGPPPTRGGRAGQAEGMKNGLWVPTDFSRTYVTGTGSGKRTSSTDPVVRGLDCAKGEPANPSKGASNGAYGTHLASAMKGAARKLLYSSENNLSSLPARPGAVRKVIVFETDGRPFEVFNGGVTDLGDPDDVAAGFQVDNTANGQRGCQNLVEVAAKAKAAEILVITIGFGEATSANCTDGSTSNMWTRDALAAAASPSDSGAASAASACDSTTSRAAENADGDYYFCAAQGSELANIFKTAVAQVSTGVRLVKLPQ
ncbi:TadE/TadG family type IV pilus assembly protein [Nocardioides astragali]|uniref:TadE/TadG family type IV pilus assembly protein n=1 Tax=Nocardioides astragali TaxID=1776736 RepID=A0ABW2N810_9ACTN|nr:pilus assembly protein TadG-related protein [Nocardioides astragali]